MHRRQVLKALSLTTAALLLDHGSAGEARAAGTDASCADNGTPNQFTPKAPKDAAPLDEELNKYPKCPYCGMNRREHHAFRHLIHYQDDLVDAVCSLHCAALSLSLNIDRGPKAIYAADYAAAADPRPLVASEKAVYLIGSKLKSIMTTRSKLAYADRAAAEKAMGEQGGELGDFAAALTAAYLDMAKDTLTIRKMREERRKKQAASAPG